jgi:hypothetical protein
MSRANAAGGWLENTSDWLSPMVVKEIRQMTRGREFHYSFSAGLMVSLAIAFYGAAASTAGDGTTGAGTFTALMVCLTLLGMLVVPIAAFSALRTERLEQTLELVTITALSPRRVVVGKLMAQAVKLVALFSALAPFMAMSFLLGGIDFFTILISLGVLFLWSLWAAAAFLFLSTLFRSRAMSGVVFGAAGILMLFVTTIGRFAFFGMRFVVRSGPAGSRADFWWGLAMVMTGCVAMTVNLVLLAENRLAVPTGNRVTPLRIGFFAQFMLIVAWSLSYLASPPGAKVNAADTLTVLGGFHLAMVALFTVTEDLEVPRRVWLQMQRRSRWDPLLALLRPGGGRGAAYVLVQMLLLVFAGWLLDPSLVALRGRLALCAYICFFSGLPAYIWRRRHPGREAAFHLRVASLVFVALASVLPDVLYYVIGQPPFLDFDFGRRHLVSPLRALANWTEVERMGWLPVPVLIGLAGVVAYAGLMWMGAMRPVQVREPEGVPAID